MGQNPMHKNVASVDGRNFDAVPCYGEKLVLTGSAAQTLQMAWSNPAFNARMEAHLVDFPMGGAGAKLWRVFLSNDQGQKEFAAVPYVPGSTERLLAKLQAFRDQTEGTWVEVDVKQEFAVKERAVKERGIQAHDLFYVSHIAADIHKILISGPEEWGDYHVGGEQYSTILFGLGNLYSLGKKIYPDEHLSEEDDDTLDKVTELLQQDVSLRKFPGGIYAYLADDGEPVVGFDWTKADAKAYLSSQSGSTPFDSTRVPVLDVGGDTDELLAERLSALPERQQEIDEEIKKLQKHASESDMDIFSGWLKTADVKSRIPGIIKQIPGLQKMDPAEAEKFLIDLAAQADPTVDPANPLVGTGVYLSWLARQAMNGGLKPEQYTNIRQALDVHNSKKNLPIFPADLKDINRFGNPEDLINRMSQEDISGAASKNEAADERRQRIEKAKQQKAKYEKKMEEAAAAAGIPVEEYKKKVEEEKAKAAAAKEWLEQANKDGNILDYTSEDGKWQVFRLTNWEASKKYYPRYSIGWCTGDLDSPHYYNQYTDGGKVPLYVIWHKGSPFAQISPVGGDFLGLKNRTLEKEEVAAIYANVGEYAPIAAVLAGRVFGGEKLLEMYMAGKLPAQLRTLDGLLKILDAVSDLDKVDADKAQVGRKVVDEILEFPDNAHNVLSRVISFWEGCASESPEGGKERLPKLEKLIVDSKDSALANEYYTAVLKKGRWPQVEHFMKSLDYSTEYKGGLVPLYTEPIEESESSEEFVPSEGEQLNLLKKDPVSKRMQNLVKKFEAGEIDEAEFEKKRDNIRLVPASYFLGMARE